MRTCRRREYRATRPATDRGTAPARAPGRPPLKRDLGDRLLLTLPDRLPLVRHSGHDQCSGKAKRDGGVCSRGGGTAAKCQAVDGGGTVELGHSAGVPPTLAGDREHVVDGNLQSDPADEVALASTTGAAQWTE